jgi:lipid-binding SYLF domain-containing protein
VRDRPEKEKSMDIDRRAALVAVAGVAVAAVARPATAATAQEIETRVDKAIEELIATVDGADQLMETARGVLIMPNVVKGGLIVGGAYGEGALRVQGATVGYYSVAAASFGFQAGVQTTKQALFFMTDSALQGFRNSSGWEVGADAEVTVPGDGLAAQVNTTTGRRPIIGVVFGQDGFLAGASLEGAKYSPITR